jgi:hypothetical protein
MRKKFVSASTLALVLLVLSGSGVRSTYSAASMTIAPDACQSACVDEMSRCIASGQPEKRCLGQYHQCNNQCRK